MKIYLSARYGRQFEMCACRAALGKLGHQVVSTWINGTEDPDPDKLSQHAFTVLHEISDADAIICFLDSINDWRGGNHTEFGIALAQGLKLFSVGGVGGKTNVFHTLAGVTRYENFAQLLRDWGPREG